MNPLLLLVLGLVLVIGVGMLIFISLRGKRNPELDKAQYRKRWADILTQAKSGQPAALKISIIEADQLVDQAMKDRMIPGDNMGERLKAVGNKWPGINELWAAHKLRNRIAHEANVQVKLSHVKQALRAFESALRQLGAL